MGAPTPFVNEPMDNSALTLLPSLLFHALTERLCVIALGFTALPGRIWWEWVWEKSYGCTESLASHFPTVCLGEKLGLKLPKHIYKMLSLFYFIKLVLTLQAVLEAGVFELCLLWRDVAGAGQDFPQIAPPLEPPSLAQGKQITLVFAGFFLPVPKETI